MRKKFRWVILGRFHPVVRKKHSLRGEKKIGSLNEGKLPFSGPRAWVTGDLQNRPLRWGRLGSGVMNSGATGAKGP